MISDKVYDVLKYIAIVAIPIVGTFLGNVLPIWGVDSLLVTKITTTISELGVLLAGLLMISTYIYKKNGDAKIDEEDME